MEITVTGRHVQVTDRFRQLLTEKLAKVEQFAPRTQRVDVVVSHERSRNSAGRESVEITCLAKGPVIRAEASAEDKYAAVDLAVEKLSERLRRAGDRRRRVQRRRFPAGPIGVVGEAPTPAEPEGTELDGTLDVGDSPISVREKIHHSAPMTLDQALSAMELVGHDFFLYHDKETSRPSVVYKRHGWEYGVLRLEVGEEDAG